MTFDTGSRPIIDSLKSASPKPSKIFVATLSSKLVAQSGAWGVGLCKSESVLSAMYRGSVPGLIVNNYVQFSIGILGFF